MNTFKFSGVFLAALLCGLSLPAHSGCLLGCTLSVTKVAGNDLRFGPMIVISGGSLTLNPQTGIRSGTANVVTPAALASSSGPAAFRVTCNGIGSISYRVHLDNTPATINKSPASMAIGNFVAYPAVSLERRITDCQTHSEIVTVGATLTVVNPQSAGQYTSMTDIQLHASVSSLL